MSKFLLNLLVQNSKALVYSKIKFYSEKNFPRHFRPIWPFSPATAQSLFINRPIFPPLPHWASAIRPAQPTITAQPATGRLLPPAPKPSTAPPPAGLTPPPRSPRRLHRKRKTAASNSPLFPPINRRHPPLFNPENRPLQPRH
jgi:hypothetical protein